MCVYSNKIFYHFKNIKRRILIQGSNNYLIYFYFSEINICHYKYDETKQKLAKARTELSSITKSDTTAEILSDTISAFMMQNKGRWHYLGKINTSYSSDEITSANVNLRE